MVRWQIEQALQTNLLIKIIRKIYDLKFAFQKKSVLFFRIKKELQWLVAKTGVCIIHRLRNRR